MEYRELLNSEFTKRLRQSVTFSWDVFANKVANGQIEINKEASMQLHYSHILQQVAPLICFRNNQNVSFLLESNEIIEGKNHLIDLVVIGHDGEEETKIAIEMKCYRRLSSSGNLRGAQNIFMKDVYADLERTETYVMSKRYNHAILLVMTDYSHFIHPTKKSGTAWEHHDISDGFKLKPRTFSEPVGGKEVNINLSQYYDFSWNTRGDFFFCELEGFTR